MFFILAHAGLELTVAKGGLDLGWFSCLSFLRVVIVALLSRWRSLTLAPHHKEGKHSYQAENECTTPFLSGNLYLPRGLGIHCSGLLQQAPELPALCLLSCLMASVLRLKSKF